MQGVGGVVCERRQRRNMLQAVRVRLPPALSKQKEIEDIFDSRSRNHGRLRRLPSPRTVWAPGLRCGFALSHQMLEMLHADETLIYCSDFPHFDWNDPVTTFPKLPADLHQRILATEK